MQDESKEKRTADVRAAAYAKKVAEKKAVEEARRTEPEHQHEIGKEMAPQQPWRKAPPPQLPPLEAEVSANGAVFGAAANKPVGTDAVPGDAFADVVHQRLETAKCDKMCEKIDHSVNMLTLNATAHLLAADYYYSRYCALAIPSIAFSSLVSVMGAFLPAGMVETGIQPFELDHSHPECT